MKKLITLLFVCCICVCSAGTVVFAEDTASPMTETEVAEALSSTVTQPAEGEFVFETTPVPGESNETPEQLSPDDITIPTGPAEPSENTVDFSTTIYPTVVDVTIPLNVDIYINPNEDDGFLYGTIEIQNHTKAPVIVSIKDFQTETIPFRKCISPYELPSGLNWNNMSVTQTQQYFSLGIKPIFYNNKAWEEEYVRDYVYARDNFVQTNLGVISGEQTAYLGLRSYYGKAFTEEKRFQFSATFVVELKQ